MERLIERPIPKPPGLVVWKAAKTLPKAPVIDPGPGARSTRGGTLIDCRRARACGFQRDCLPHALRCPSHEQHFVINTNVHFRLDSLMCYGTDALVSFR